MENKKDNPSSLPEAEKTGLAVRRTWENRILKRTAPIFAAVESAPWQKTDGKIRGGSSSVERKGKSTDTTQDKVFLLSEADVFGTSGSVSVATSHYTTGARLTAPGGSWATGSWYWLRSPRYNTVSVARVGSNGGANNSGFNGTSGGVRPALWVNLGGRKRGGKRCQKRL